MKQLKKKTKNKNQNISLCLQYEKSHQQFHIKLRHSYASHYFNKPNKQINYENKMLFFSFISYVAQELFTVYVALIIFECKKMHLKNE